MMEPTDGSKATTPSTPADSSSRLTQETRNDGSSLVELAVESWRFARLFAKVIAKLDAGEAPRFESQRRYYLKKLEEYLSDAGFKLVNLEGHSYDAGIAASALNIADFDADDHLIIDQMLEPIIMHTNGLARPGTVMLQKVTS
jgi:hypothetical protein